MKYYSVVKKYALGFIDWFVSPKIQFIVALLFIFFLFRDLSAGSFWMVVVDLFCLWGSLTSVFKKVKTVEVTVKAEKQQ